MTNSQFDECPSLAYWFRKDLPGHVSFSLPAACRKGEPAATPVFSLAGDWIRQEDGIVRSETTANQLWRFRGVRKFEEEDLTAYGFDSYEFVRIYAVDLASLPKVLNEIFPIKKVFKGQ